MAPAALCGAAGAGPFLDDSPVKARFSPCSCLTNKPFGPFSLMRTVCALTISPPHYLTDALDRVHGQADALAFPLTTEEVSALLRYAHDHDIPVTPRGAGTNLVGSTIPTKGGIVLDLSRMDRVLELDRDTMTITVEPGMLLQDLQAYVEERGLFYPPDPGEKAASIGGSLPAGRRGLRGARHRPE